MSWDPQQMALFMTYLIYEYNFLAPTLTYVFLFQVVTPIRVGQTYAYSPASDSSHDLYDVPPIRQQGVSVTINNTYSCRCLYTCIYILNTHTGVRYSGEQTNRTAWHPQSPGPLRHPSFPGPAIKRTVWHTANVTRGMIILQRIIFIMMSW